MEFTVFEHAEGLAGVVDSHHGYGIKNVAEFVTIHAVEAGVIGVHLGAQYRPAFGVGGEWWVL